MWTGLRWCFLGPGCWACPPPVAWSFASDPAGFTSMWDREIGTRARFLAPTLIGISFRLTDDLPRPAIFLRRDLPTLPSRYSGFQLWCDFHRDSVPIVCSDYGGVVHFQHRASGAWPGGWLLDSGGPLSTARTHHSREWVQFTHGRLRLPVA